ncbi:MAG: hypothetical protein CMM07_14015 [Rhodopirellula sp.]|nr:hypothetical protein [Rhodopirellula sp.]
MKVESSELLSSIPLPWRSPQEPATLFLTASAQPALVIVQLIWVTRGTALIAELAPQKGLQ